MARFSKYKYILAGLALTTGLGLLIKPASADAASCPKTSTRIATSSNRIYISGSSTVCTPADLNALYPTYVTMPKARTYLVRSNIILQQGATLSVVGGTAAGSTTDELRLLSNNNSTTNNYVAITADYGNIKFDSTTVKSWNEAAGGVDTEYGGTYKRAYINVRSRVVNGVAQTSRMDINNSDISYLGYDGSESYGLSWKVEGGAFSTVDVLGDVTNSRMHNNYFGMYTFGAYGMNIDNNQVDNNVKYGIDTHDDSDYLVITNNRTHHNGDHGIICSQRCDHLTIKGNQSYNNVGHGIMLHRSTDYSTVEDNTVSYNTDSGIALFESNNDTITGNTVNNNLNGIRFSVGSSFNTISNNTISNNRGNSIYTFKGSDTPTRGDGINRDNTWTNNKVSGSGVYVLKLSSTDGDKFDSNDFRNNPGAKYYLSGATNTTFTNNQTDPGVNL